MVILEVMYIKVQTRKIRINRFRKRKLQLNQGRPFNKLNGLV